jgi:hypothetical protein
VTEGPLKAAGKIKRIGKPDFARDLSDGESGPPQKLPRKIQTQFLAKTLRRGAELLAKKMTKARRGEPAVRGEGIEFERLVKTRGEALHGSLHAGVASGCPLVGV